MKISCSDMTCSDTRMTKQRIYLSSPHMSGLEQQLIEETSASNWIAPLGPQVDAFEAEFAAKVGAPHALALRSGTAALHLALLLWPGLGQATRYWFRPSLSRPAPTPWSTWVAGPPSRRVLKKSPLTRSGCHRHTTSSRSRRNPPICSGALVGLPPETGVFQ